MALQNGLLANAGVFLSRLDEHGEGWLTRTETDGGFRFAHVPPGAYHLSVSCGAIGTIHKQDLAIEGDTHLDLSLGAAWARGRLVDAVTDQPLAGIGVRLSPTADQHGHNPDGSITVSSHELAGGTTTDADGRFALGPLQPGRWKLGATPEGYVPAERTIRIENGADALVELALLPTPGLDLDVTTRFGAVPEKVTLLLRSPGDPCGDPAAELLSHRPRGERTIHWPEAPPGSWVLTVRTPYGAVASERITIPGPRAQIVLPAGGRVVVMVRALEAENALSGTLRPARPRRRAGPYPRGRPGASTSHRPVETR